MDVCHLVGKSSSPDWSIAGSPRVDIAPDLGCIYELLWYWKSRPRSDIRQRHAPFVCWTVQAAFRDGVLTAVPVEVVGALRIRATRRFPRPSHRSPTHPSTPAILHLPRRCVCPALCGRHGRLDRQISRAVLPVVQPTRFPQRTGPCTQSRRSRRVRVQLGKECSPNIRQ